jgi:hypothetical protein
METQDSNLLLLNAVSALFMDSTMVVDCFMALCAAFRNG